tara:strand:+ start:1771 stop:2163 length:393 start_codon:yes stop_codon:yes gene_type:complete
MQPGQPRPPVQKPEPVYIPAGSIHQPVFQGIPQQMPGQMVIINNSGGNGNSTASLVLGLIAVMCSILGFGVCFTWLVGWIFAVLAVVFGHIGLANSKHRGGSGTAIVGLICGYLTLAFYLIPFIFVAAYL